LSAEYTINNTVTNGLGSMPTTKYQTKDTLGITE